MLAIARKKNWPSGEYFSVDGTLIQAWAGHKSVMRKDGGDKESDNGGSLKENKRSNETHESKTDPDAKFRCQAGAENLDVEVTVGADKGLTWCKHLVAVLGRS